MRKRIGVSLLWLSRFSFYVLLVLMPLSSRWVLRQHHAFGLHPEYISALFYIVDIPLLITVAAWLLANLLDPSRSIHFSLWPLTAPLLALVGLSLLSILWALAPSVATEFAVRLLLLFVLYIFLLNEIHEHRWPALALGAGVALQSLVAVGQFLARSPLGLFALGEMKHYTFTPGASVIQVGTQRWLRGYGLSPSPNVLGGILGLGLFALLGWGMLSRRAQPVGWLAALGLGIAGLICTFSRAAWLGLGVGLFIIGTLLWYSPERQIRPAFWQLIAVGLGVGLAFIVVYPQLFTTRLLIGSENSLEILNLDLREHYKQVAWNLIGRYPLGGVGSGNFTLAAAIENPPKWGYHSYQPVHDTLLLFMAELGMGGGALWLVAWSCQALALWQNRSRIGQHPWLLVWTGALVAVGTLSNFDHYLFTYQQGRLLLWISLGLWASAARERVEWRWPASAEPDTCPQPRAIVRRDWAGFALTILGLVVAGTLLYVWLIRPRGTLLWDPAGFALGGWKTLHNLRAGNWIDLVHDLLQRPTYPPGHPLLMTGIFALFGASETVARLVSLGAFLAAAALMYWLGWEFAPSADSGSLTGGLAVGLTLSAPTLLYLSSDVQLEPPGLLFTLATVLCACRAVRHEQWSKRWKWLAATGLLATATFFIKYNYGLTVLIGLWGAALLAGGGWEQRWRPLSVLAVTTLLPIGLWFSTDEGRLEAFMDFAINRSSGLNWWEGVLVYPIALLREYASHWILGCAIFLAFGLTLARWRKRDSRTRVLLTTTLAGLAMAVLHPYKQARFIYTVAPLFLLPAAVWGAKAVRWWERWKKWGNASLRRWMRMAVLIIALLVLNVLGVTSALRRYQGGENERLNYDAAAQAIIEEMLTFVNEHVDPAQGVLVNGYFNAFSEDLLRWMWRDRSAGKPLLLYGLPFEGKALRERYDVSDDRLLYVLRLEQTLNAARVQSVVSIAVQPSSRFYTTDYDAWNAWQEGYDVAISRYPALEMAEEAYFDQEDIRVRIYRFVSRE